MGQRIPIHIDNSVLYERFITGQGGIPPINEKDDVVVLDFVMPHHVHAKIQWGEYGDAPNKRWIITTGPPAPFPVKAQIAGTLNFTTAQPKPGTNDMHTPEGTHVTIEVYQYDPETTPSHGDSWNDSRNMLFDWATQD